MIGWLERRKEYSGSMKGVMIPIGWALYNLGLWVAIGFGFGTHNAQVLWLYFSAMCVLLLFAMLMYVNKLRNPIDPTRRRLPLRADAGLVGAFGVAFVGLGIIFGAWWYPFATVFLFSALWLAVKDWMGYRRIRPKSPVQ